ncbi:MAG: ATP synthase F0F1 subunit epsilon [Spirochaetes bacterium DG_61]|nr:MAG: ATP synthase F0F1 subunit epsilon [Spirochaetes bacterium DG_61]
MNLKVLLPTKMYIDQNVVKVVAEAENGSFCLLPRHIDFVAALVPGILSYESVEGQEEFVAVDEGILVKVGQEVLISTRNAERSSELGKLKETVEKSFQVLDDRERKARSAAAKLEADLARKFLELGRHERY